MYKKRKQEILDKMLKIKELVDSQLDLESQSRENITYYQNFQFGGSRLAEENVYIVEINNQKNKKIGDRSELQQEKQDENEELQVYKTYEIYNEDSNLIATVDEQGKIHFNEKYLESKKEINKKYFLMLQLEDVDFEIPERLQKDDVTVTKDELDKHEKEKGKNKDNQKQEENTEEQGQESIAKEKGITPNNILKIREDSNLYQDHPYLEPNLYFYRDNDGIVRAEYIDENGNPQPSKYFEPSTTSLRQETISMGSDGKPITKEVPYQVMQTKNLANTDKDIRDVRINIEIDQYGYLEISEARQGKNGMWLSHDIEVQGRDYNSYDLDKATSIMSRQANPDKQTEAYERIEDTGFIEDGIHYNELYLMKHSEEIIREFMDEGYQREEAVEIFNLMIGEEALTEEQAKERVNEKIKEQEKERAKEKNKQKEIEQEDEGYERTPWSEAEERRR